jgi:hypothetical protein
MALPLMVKGLNSSVFKLGKQTGIIYAWNTWGNVAGAVLGGLFLLPWLGVEKLMLMTALATMLLGVAALAIFSDRAARVRFALPVLGLTAIAMVFYLFAGRWDQRWFTTASFRRSLESMDFGEVKKDLDNVEVLLFEDDPSSHLIVTRVKSVNPPTYGIYVNGKADASSSTVDMTTQVLLGQIGLLLHPNPQNVLVVGLATGVTLGSALAHPIAKADVVDIVRKMPMATAYFEPWNHHATSDARTRFIADDARGYLSYTRQKYDVIISEPSNPWVSGVSSLFTKEYYNRASHALSKGGIFVQWLQAYEMSDQTFIAILRTFQSEFPYVYAFQGSAKDLILLGLKAPLAVDFSRLAAALEREPVRGDLGRIGINGVSSFLFLQRLSPGTIRVLSSLSEMENTDDNRFLEYRAPRDFFQQAKPAILIRSDERLRLPSALFWHKWIQAYPRNLGEQTILNFIGRPGIAEDEVLRAFTMMQMFSDPEKLLPQLIAANLKEPSYSTSVIANRIDFLLQQRLYPPAAEFLDQVGSGIILDVSASSERRSSWLALGEQWWNQSRNANQEPVFRGFWIDLLLASGESSKAASQILEWVRSARTPSPEWAFQRIYSLQNEKLTMELAEAYSRKSSHPLVEENRAATSGR